MPASLDTRRAHLVRQHGDITAIFTWINDERAMVLAPNKRPGAPWYVVMESAAFTWDDTLSEDAPAVARKAMKACEVLGIEPNVKNAVRMVNMIANNLPDLVKMPSSPPAEMYKGSFGNMELRADGKTVAAEDITLEKEGVTYG
jgi:hypothetical protein